MRISSTTNSSKLGSAIMSKFVDLAGNNLRRSVGGLKAFEAAFLSDYSIVLTMYSIYILLYYILYSILLYHIILCY